MPVQQIERKRSAPSGSSSNSAAAAFGARHCDAVGRSCLMRTTSRPQRKSFSGMLASSRRCGSSAATLGASLADIGVISASYLPSQDRRLLLTESPPVPTKPKKRKRREKPRKMVVKRIAALLTEGLAEHKEACKTDVTAKDEAITTQESKLVEQNQGLAALHEQNRKKHSKAIAKVSNKMAQMKQAKNWVQKELDKLLTINETMYRLHCHKDLECELGLLGRYDYHSFRPQTSAVQRLLDGIREARRSLTGVVTSLTNLEVAQALVDTQDMSGVVIYILAEKRKVCSSKSTVKAFNL